MSTKVLVTGAKGQLGQTMQQLFGKKTSGLVFTYVSKNVLNITNEIHVASFLKEHKFDYCINCAAYTNVEQAEKIPEIAFKINADGVKHLAKACKENQTVLIHISTDYVFDGEKKEPYTEDDIPNPINSYGKSKLLGEQYIQEVLSDYFIIRTSWLYSNFGHNFYKTIIKKINEGQELKVITTQTGTPTSCIELSKFIYFLISSKEKPRGLYHFSAFDQATWYDFALEISRYFNYPSIVPLTAIKESVIKANRPRYSVLNNQKARLLGFSILKWQEALNQILGTIK